MATKDIKNIDIIVKKQPTGSGGGSASLTVDYAGCLQFSRALAGGGLIESVAGTEGGNVTSSSKVVISKSVSNIKNNLEIGGGCCSKCHMLRCTCRPQLVDLKHVKVLRIITIGSGYWNVEVSYGSAGTAVSRAVTSKSIGGY
ncbi:MAG TPA: hypothetical protein VM120_14270 [Bryobacteraceae bacterium]|nr:hypothetical protein [Bryobacteraceae bacterium]